MFNPSDLSVSVGGSQGEWAFVGVKRKPSGQMEFCIPTGFEDFPTNDSEKVNRLFFDLYKVFRRFSSDIRKASDSQTQNTRGGNTFQQESFSFVDKDEEVVTLYSKIPMLENVLESYDDLRVFLLTGHDTKTNQVNYARLERYLSKAIYLEDDTAFIDVMTIPKPVIRYDISDLVRLYCFIYLEIKRALNEESTLPGEVEAQAEIFKGQHLRSDSGLFVESHSETISLLKETLAEIERQITWKDTDYWYFFRVIENFLYGDLAEDKEGEGWGISKFSAVWEAMCIEWIFCNNQHSDILFADTALHNSTKIGNRVVHIDESFKNPFYLSHEGNKRFLRPDLVKRDSVTDHEALTHILEISFTGNDSYHVKLIKKDKEGRHYFLLLSEKWGLGFRRPPSFEHTFRYVNPEMYKRGMGRILAEIRKDRRKGKESVDKILLVDFKYVSSSIYEVPKLGKKATSDIYKQRVYEIALLVNGIPRAITSQFCLPKFYSSPMTGIGQPISDSQLNAMLGQNKIQVFQVDYSKISNSYIGDLQL